MKKPLLALAAITLMAVNMNAQADKKFRLGLELCPNMGWLKTDEKGYENDGTRTGFRFGLLGDFRMGDANYFFSTGAFLNNVGAKSKTTFTDTSGASSSITGELKLQYVEVPISIKLKTEEIGYMTYFGQIGFDAGFNTGAEFKLGDGEFEDVEEVAPVRIALLVGGGLEYNFAGNTSALVGVKYSNAFTDAWDSDGPDARLHYFEITLGALF